MFNNTHHFVVISLLLIQIFSTSHAEITLDGSLGLAGEVPLQRQQYDIKANFGTLAGNNLFHSFGRFNIGTNETATFSSPSHIENIISRITGGENSFIDGTLVSPANLYLLNPNGFILGRNARLNVEGSFHLSSANYLRFADGQRFNTQTSTPPLLSVAAPEAFGFLESHPGDIFINGSILKVPENENLSVIGGDIKLQRDERLFGGATLRAPSGKIQMASVASTGEVAHSNVTNNTLTRFGNVAVTDNGFIDVSNSSPNQPGGTLIIQSGQFFMSNSVIESDAGKGTGYIKIVSTNGFRMTEHAKIQNRTQQGQAGDIVLHGQQIELSAGSIVFSATDGIGQAGNIIIEAQDSISVTGNNSLIITATNGDGKGGNIELRANHIKIQQDGIVATESWGQGKAGNILISAGNLSLFQGDVSTRSYNVGETGQVVLRVNGDLQIDAGLIEAVTSNQGDANKIELKVGNLVLTNGAQINASSNSTGKGGEITIEVSGTANISGHAVVTAPDTGKSQITLSGIASSTFDKGNGGTIRISAHSLTIDKQGTIQTLTKGDGNAGDIVINVHDLRITNSGDIDASNEGTGSGKGGNITINATGSVLITAQPADDETIGRVKQIVKEGFLGGIYSIAENEGSGGDITLTTPQLELRDGGVISVGSIGLGNAGNLRMLIDCALKMENAAIITQATQAGGGNISIETPTKIHLMKSEITAKAAGLKPEHKGGNVTITNQAFFVLNNARILANAVRGNGGNISITSTNFIPSADSQLDASSELGVDGKISINAPEVDLSSIVVPPTPFLASEPFSDKRCEALIREDLSSFFMRGLEIRQTAPDDFKTHW